MPIQKPETSFNILFIKPCSAIRPQMIEIPLAFLYLSAYLKQHLKHGIRIDLIDLRLTKHPSRALKKKLGEFVPHLVGISLLTQDRVFLPEWCGFLKRHAPATQIVIGGPYVTAEYEEALRHNPAVDYAVIGEGEEAFRCLVTALMQGKEIKPLPGIAYVDGGEVISGGKSVYLDNLDSIPLPEYGLINFDSYQRFTQLPMNGIATTRKRAAVISSRGCPYGCVYCHNIFGKKVRKRSPEHFVAEMRLLYSEHGVREFHIVDDIFNIDRQRMHAIMHLIISSGMKVRLAFPNGLRADLLNEEDLLLLKEAGTYIITVAIETASQRVQKLMNKHLDIRKASHSINFANKVGIVTKGTFILGFPGETRREIRQTVAYAVKSKLDMAAFFSAVPFPNTALALLIKKMFPDMACEAQWYMWDPKPFYQRATGYPLKRVQSMAYLRFYSPLRVMRTFLKMPGKAFMMMWPVWGLQILFPSLFRKSTTAGGPSCPAEE